jgi:hypothetical protein
MSDNQYMVREFYRIFESIGLIVIPEFNGLGHDFMKLLDENGVTYQFEFLKEESFNFWKITRL